MNVFEKDLAGMPLDGRDPEVAPIIEVIKQTQRIVARLNSGVYSEEEVRDFLSQITGRAIDSTLWLIPPFYTDFGRNIHFGKNVFVNSACTFMDRRGSDYFARSKDRRKFYHRSECCGYQRCAE